MQNYSVGIHHCAITKQLERCVTVFLGHIETEDQGPIEVWSHLSEVALRSLRLDLTEPGNREHGCGFGLDECCVTGQQTACIRALVAILPELRNGEPTGREAVIHASLSLEGIDHLLACLSQEPVLLDLATLAEMTKQTPYGWVAIHRNGEIVCQFSYGQPDRSFGDVRLPEVDAFLIEPRDLGGKLPIYRLDEMGFWRVAGRNGVLPLPIPDEPFAFRYYRRVTCTMLLGGGTGKPSAPHIVQVLGWRIERPAGDLICELGVEEDGAWTIYRRGRLIGDQYLPLLEDEFLAAMDERRD